MRLESSVELPDQQKNEQGTSCAKPEDENWQNLHMYLQTKCMSHHWYVIES